jgi:hypothetical protein
MASGSGFPPLGIAITSRQTCLMLRLVMLATRQ